MNIIQKVLYLERVKQNGGNRKNPLLIYVTKGGKDDCLIFHTKEESNYYQYRAKSVLKKSITLMCIYSRNSRAK